MTCAATNARIRGLRSRLSVDVWRSASADVWRMYSISFSKPRTGPGGYRRDNGGLVETRLAGSAQLVRQLIALSSGPARSLLTVWWQQYVREPKNTRRPATNATDAIKRLMVPLGDYATALA